MGGHSGSGYASQPQDQVNCRTGGPVFDRAQAPTGDKSLRQSHRVRTSASSNNDVQTLDWVHQSSHNMKTQAKPGGYGHTGVDGRSRKRIALKEDASSRHSITQTHNRHNSHEGQDQVSDKDIQHSDQDHGTSDIQSPPLPTNAGGNGERPTNPSESQTSGHGGDTRSCDNESRAPASGIGQVQPSLLTRSNNEPRRDKRTQNHNRPGTNPSSTIVAVEIEENLGERKRSVAREPVVNLEGGSLPNTQPRNLHSSQMVTNLEPPYTSVPSVPGELATDCQRAPSVPGRADVPSQPAPMSRGRGEGVANQGAGGRQTAEAATEHHALGGPAAQSPRSQVSNESNIETQPSSMNRNGSFTPHATSQVLRPEDLLQRIRNALTNASKTGYWPTSTYIPISDLVRILNVEVVAAILPAFLPGGDYRQSSCTRLPRIICGEDAKRGLEKGDEKGYDRILAILILVKKANQLKQFLDFGINNGYLPLQQDPHGNLISGRDGETCLFLSDACHWDETDQSEFFTCQWRVLAPVLGPAEVSGPVMDPETDRNTVRHYEIPYFQPLPFIEIDAPKESRNRMAGGFSEVRRIKIHHSHNKFTSHSVSTRSKYLCQFTADPSYPRVLQSSIFGRKARTTLGTRSRTWNYSAYTTTNTS